MVPLTVANQVFVVALSQPVPDVAERLRSKYPGGLHYAHGDQTFLVQAEPGVLTRQVAKDVGLHKDADSDPVALGAVFKLNGAYSGWAKPELWEWLSTAMEDAP